MNRSLNTHIATGLLAMIAVLSVRQAMDNMFFFLVACYTIIFGVATSLTVTLSQRVAREKVVEIVSCVVLGWGLWRLVTGEMQFGKILLVAIDLLVALLIMHSFLLSHRPRYRLFQILALVLIMCGFIAGHSPLQNQFLCLASALFCILVIFRADTIEQLYHSDTSSTTPRPHLPIYSTSWFFAALAVFILFIAASPFISLFPRFETLPPEIMETPLLQNSEHEEKMDDPGFDAMHEMHDGGLGDESISKYEEALPNKPDESNVLDEASLYTETKTADTILTVSIEEPELTPEQLMAQTELQEKEEEEEEEEEELPEPITAQKKEPQIAVIIGTMIYIIVIICAFLGLIKGGATWRRRQWTQMAMYEPRKFLRILYAATRKILCYCGVRPDRTLTPKEFSGKVSTSYPSCAPHIETMTTLANSARYSLHDPQPAEVEQAYSMYKEIVDYLTKSGNIKFFTKIFLKLSKITLPFK